MPSTTAAERILRLVTEPGRATSIVGDLLEEAPGRGRVWFWVSVAQTVYFAVLREFRDAPCRMVWLGLSGFLEAVALGIAFVWTIIPLWMAVFPYHPDPHTTYIPPWGLVAIRVVADTAVPLFAAWHVAKRSKSRELASGVAITIVLAITGLTVAILVEMQKRRIGSLYPTVEPEMATFCATALFVMAGAILARLRGLRGTAN